VGQAQRGFELLLGDHPLSLEYLADLASDDGLDARGKPAADHVAVDNERLGIGGGEGDTHGEGEAGLAGARGR